MKLNLSAIAIIVILIIICILYDAFSKMPDTHAGKEKFLGLGSGGTSGNSGQLLLGGIITRSTGKTDNCKHSANKSGYCEYKTLKNAQTDCEALPDCAGVNMFDTKDGKIYFLASTHPSVCINAQTDPKNFQTSCTNAKKLFTKLPISKPQSYKELTSAFGKVSEQNCSSQCAAISPDSDEKDRQWCGNCYGMGAIMLAETATMPSESKTTVASYPTTSGSGFKMSAPHFELFSMPTLSGIKSKVSAEHDKNKAGADKTKDKATAQYKQKEKEFADKTNKYITKGESIGNKINNKLFGWLE